jgi:hypothetical protein
MTPLRSNRRCSLQERRPFFIRSLDDATLFLRGYRGRWPATRNLILRRLDTASSEQEMGEAEKSFRWWAQMEGLLARLE